MKKNKTIKIELDKDEVKTYIAQGLNNDQVEENVSFESSNVTLHEDGAIVVKEVEE